MDVAECVDTMSLVDTEVNLEVGAVSASQISSFVNQDKSCGLIINDTHTDIVVKNYKNRMFLIVTQFKKIGSLITVTREETAKSDVYSIKTILGKDDDDTHLAARYIAEQISIDKPLLISICLKDYTVETLRRVAAAIKKLQSL